MIFKNHLDMIGNTPIVRFGEFKKSVIWLKLEGNNPTGSLKDRTAKAIIQSKIDSGELVEGKTILDATSGSFGCSIAFIGNKLGFPVTVVANKKLTESNRKFIKFFGAETINYGEVTRHGYVYCRDTLVPENPEKYCFLDQLNNEASPLAHFHGTAFEILQDLPEVDAIAVSMGSGATLLGIANYFSDYKPKVKIIASTAKPGKRIAGTYLPSEDYVTPFIQESWDRGWPHFTGATSWEEALRNVNFLAEKGNFFVGPQTGGIFQAVKQAIDSGITGNIVIVSGDTGWKNVDKIM